MSVMFDTTWFEMRLLQAFQILLISLIENFADSSYFSILIIQIYNFDFFELLLLLSIIFEFELIVESNLIVLILWTFRHNVDKQREGGNPNTQKF